MIVDPMAAVGSMAGMVVGKEKVVPVGMLVGEMEGFEGRGRGSGDVENQGWFEWLILKRGAD